jgi:hypothetical protein
LKIEPQSRDEPRKWPETGVGTARTTKKGAGSCAGQTCSEFRLLAALIDELIQIGRTQPSEWPGCSSRFLSEAKGRARQIGSQLHELGGKGYMLAAHQPIRQALGPVGARELEMAWDGIGNWMS